MTNILTHLPAVQASKYKNGHTALRYVPYGKTDVVDMDWSEFDSVVDRAASAFINLDVERQGMVAVFSPNRPESVIVDFAAYAVRAVPVSIYATSSPDQVKYILRDSASTIVFVGDAHQFFTVAEIAADCASLKHIVVYDPRAEVPGRVGNCDVHKWSDFLAMADGAGHRQAAERTAEATPDDVATLIYTSGTTGEPKGAVLTHRCFDAVMRIHRQRLDYLTDADRSLSFLPMCHIFEKAWTYFCMYTGMTVTVNEDPRAVTDALLRERPTCMCAVPRFWEKAYAAINDKIEHAPWYKRLIFRRAIEIGRRRNLHYRRLGLKVPAWLERRYRFYDRIVLAPARRAMGVDKGRLFPTAGAPLSSHITEFFIAAGVPLIVGYGLSETSATVTCYPTTGYVVGSVGTRMPEVEVRIGQDNEIQVKAQR